MTGEPGKRQKPSAVPEFSVIICTFNRLQLLPRAVESALNQTLSDLEILVVDDHSEPGVEALLERYSDQRLRYLRQPENRGVAAGTNAGLAAARGRYVTILNDDDCFHPEFLERMSQHLRASGAVFAWCGIEDAWEDHKEVFERVVKPTHYQDPWALEELLTRVGLGYGFTIEADRLRELGGLDERLRSSEDTELFLRLVQQPWAWQSLPECLVRVFRQEIRLTRPSLRRAQDLRLVLEKHQAFLAAHPALSRHFDLLLASLYVEFDDRAQARGLLRSLLNQHPWQPRVWLLLLANEFGLGAALLQGYRRMRAWLSRSALAERLAAGYKARSAGRNAE